MFPNVPDERINESLGSGVIVDAARGYVLTNHHVIEGADEVHLGGPRVREHHLRPVVLRRPRQRLRPRPGPFPLPPARHLGFRPGFSLDDFSLDLLESGWM